MYSIPEAVVNSIGSVARAVVTGTSSGAGHHLAEAEARMAAHDPSRGALVLYSDLRNKYNQLYLFAK